MYDHNIKKGEITQTMLIIQVEFLKCTCMLKTNVFENKTLVGNKDEFRNKI